MLNVGRCSVGGPDRPIPIPPAEKKPVERPSQPRAPASSDSQSNLYGRLQNALTERGQVISD